MRKKFIALESLNHNFGPRASVCRGGGEVGKEEEKNWDIEGDEEVCV